MKNHYKPDETIRELLLPDAKTKIERPLLGSSLPAGFPSPAEDYIEKTLDLNEYLIHHPAATFFVRVDGDSMIGSGIHHNDILIVDRSLSAEHNKIVIAVVDGYLTVKRLNTKGALWTLEPSNPAYSSITITEDMDFSVWGVVTCVIHKV
ncbi:MAG: translesion error-prone DNA polymerase V autoproteolytic subunit [Candidatus Cloacimonetes bacterium]|nr:translesion error-prone DNA polymerase V autoproteolytic subunit [Candidatus Cloacimonadota bacterium]